MDEPSDADDESVEAEEPFEEWSPMPGRWGKFFAWVILGVIGLGTAALVAMWWK